MIQSLNTSRRTVPILPAVDHYLSTIGVLLEHREPASGTVRELYGTAFGCAAPECGAALYKLSESIGRQVLNSHVAHIHARCEGGPRWDPEMSEADNHAASNLLRWRPKHHVRIFACR